MACRLINKSGNQVTNGWLRLCHIDPPPPRPSLSAMVHRPFPKNDAFSGAPWRLRRSDRFPTPTMMHRSHPFRRSVVGDPVLRTPGASIWLCLARAICCHPFSALVNTCNLRELLLSKTHMNEYDLSKTVRECALPVDTLIHVDATLEEALTSLRQKSIQHKIIYFYAVDNQNTLKGVVSSRQLLLSDPKMKVHETMFENVAKLNEHQTMKHAMELFTAHPLLAIPVVDDHGKLLGVIDLQMVSDESVDFSNEKSRSDAFQMIGYSLEERKKIPLRESYRLRMPWLLCNVFSGLICAAISRYYENVLGAYLLLAFFIPLVLTLSESSSMQSVVQSLQFLRRPRFRWKIAWLRMAREWQIVLFLALTSGILVGLLSLFWGDGFFPSAAIGVGIIASVAVSALFGIAIPIFLHRMKLDPRVAAGPVVLMIVDILTTGIYLALATWWLL